MSDAAAMSLAAISRVATGGLVAAVWQGALLSVAVGLGLRMLPKTPASVRFAIWFGVFAVVSLLPFAGLGHASGASVGHAAWLTLDARWCLVVVGAWGMASLMRAVTLLLAVFRVRALWKRATPLELSFLQPTLDDGTVMNGARERCGAGRHAELCVSSEVDRPTVIGFFAPKILLPDWLVEKLTQDELKQIVLHETGHLSRADDWMNLLQKVALVVFPLNPALAWVERRLCFERELACDEHVLQATGAPKAYAACLASLAEHRLGRDAMALALGALGRESELGRRVRRILRRGEVMRPASARLVLGGAMLALLTAAAGLERCPQIIGFASAQQVSSAALDHEVGTTMQQHGYAAQSVVFHVPARNVAGATANVRRSAEASRPRLAPRQVETVASVGRMSESAMDSVAPVAQPRAREVSDVVAPNQEQRANAGVVQWLVVTTYQREDGASMVMATAQVDDAQGRSVRMRSDVENAPTQDQVHPYAAVPVRGGWLVIQL